jgi:hypothetical protein
MEDTIVPEVKNRFMARIAFVITIFFPASE